MQKTDPDSKHNLLEDLSEMTVKTYKELELTKQMLSEKELQLMDLATAANQKIIDSAKANRELRGKVEFLQEIATSLNEKNELLERANLELATQKGLLKDCVWSQDQFSAYDSL